MPPRRPSRRVRSAVPDPFRNQRNGFSDRTADTLFGPAPGGRRANANPGLFSNAFERVKSGFEDPGTETYVDEQFTYDPTRSSNPPRPRTKRAGWIRPKGADNGVVIVQFREGAVYEYSNVPYNVWRNLRRVQSPGKAMNRSNGLIGGGYPYRRVSG